jgi:N-acyl-D-amino-acid deacylase
MIVCPGFIDGHSHSDLSLLTHPTAEQKVMQGVTTENLGLDGMSVAPIREQDIPAWRKHLSGLGGNPPLDWSWRSFGDYLDQVEKVHTGLNVTSYAGLGTIRLSVMGMKDGPATEREIEQMKEITAQCMAQGARGVSAGLIYPPSQYQSMEEIAAICRVVAEMNGIYNVHMRSESDNILGAIDEVIEIGRRSGVPVVITHFKIRGKKNWGLAGKAIAKIEDARSEGLDVSMEQYPYTAGSTMLHAVIPPWYHTGGAERLLERLKNQRERIKKDILERHDWENIAAIVGWDKVTISSVETEANKGLEGLSLTEAAREMGLEDPADAAMDLLLAESLAVGMINFGLSEDDVKTIMAHPAVSFITDGLHGGNKPHPRLYGTYPRILGHYVREEKVLTLEEAVRKMTSLPAQKLRLAKKGLIATGYDADLVIFDPETIIDASTYENPRSFPKGILWVLVNGQVVVENGRPTGRTPGRVLRSRR